MMTREHHRRRSPESSRRRRKERRDSREQLRNQQITLPAPPPEERNELIHLRSRAPSPLSSSSSTSSSLLNISRPSRRFGLGAFFGGGGSGRKQHRVKKKRSRFLRFGNSSSSSVGSDLAYGKGYVERQRSREFSPPSSSAGRPRPRHDQTDEEILELGRKFAEIARQQNAEDLKAAGRSRPSTLVGAAAALSQFRRTNSGNSNKGVGSSKPRLDDSSDDSEWESASEDESSSSEFDSGLAYGSSGLSLPNTINQPIPRRSTPSSSRSPRPSKASVYGPPLRRKSSVVDPNLFGPVNSLRGYVEAPCGFETVDRSTVVGSPRPYEPSITPTITPSEAAPDHRPLRLVYPAPTSDPKRFDVYNGPVVSSQQDLSAPLRPAPVPIQHPRPIVQVPRRVLDSVETGSGYTEHAPSEKVPEDNVVAPGSDRKDDHNKLEEKRDRDNERRSKRSGAGIQARKGEERKSHDNDNLPPARNDLAELPRETRSGNGLEFERDWHYREMIVPELKRKSEEEGRRRDEYNDDNSDHDLTRNKRKNDPEDERNIDHVKTYEKECRDEDGANRSDVRSYELTPPYTTPKRPLTPNVITVDREPNFSPERLSRRDSYERELRDAHEIYQTAEHATAPISGVAFAAAAAAVMAEDRRGRSRSRGGDASSRNRSRRDDSPKREKDAVQEDADRYYREAELARRIRDAEIRDAEPSVVDKWKQEQQPMIVDVVSPPGMDHAKKKSAYDAPDADVRIDNVLEHPNELSRFRAPDIKGLTKIPVFTARDPSAERERPMLNVVRPTPVPTPIPEGQRRAGEPLPKLVKKIDIPPPKVIPDVVTESRSEVAPAPLLAKSVSWGENQTKRYVVESPEREDDPYSGTKIVTPAKPPRSRAGKKSPWGLGFIAATLGGGNNRKASSSTSGQTTVVEATEPKKASRNGDEPANRRASVPFKSAYDSPPIPGPKPSNLKGAQMPGSFAEDPVFTANVAAALEGNGFDPNIVIDDANFHKRDSPPGSNDFSVYQAPFVESVADLGTVDGPRTTASQGGREHGFVIGEVETPSDGRDISSDKPRILSEPNRAEQHKRDKAPERDGAEEPHAMVDDSRAAELSRSVTEDDWDVLSNKYSKKERKKHEKAARAQSLDDAPIDNKPRNEQDLEAEFIAEEEDISPKKRSKKLKKAVVVQEDPRQPGIIENPKAVAPVGGSQDVQNVNTVQIDTSDRLDENDKGSKRDLERYNSPSIPTPKPEPSKNGPMGPIGADVFFTPDDESGSSRKSSRRARRDSGGSFSRTVLPSELSTASSYGIIDTADSIVDTEEEWDTPKKSKKKSRRDNRVYDSPPRSVPISEATLEDWDSFNESKNKSTQDPSVHDSLSRVALPAEDLYDSPKEMTESVSDIHSEIPAATEGELDILRKSKKSTRSSIPYEDRPSTPQSVAPSEASVGSSKRSKRDSYPDPLSTPSRAAPASDGSIDDSRKKSKKRRSVPADLPENKNNFTEGGPTDKGKDRSEILDRDTDSIVPNQACSDDNQPTGTQIRDDKADQAKVVTSTPSSANKKDRKGSKADIDKKSSGNTGFFGRLRSSIGIAEEKEPLRKLDEGKNDPFLGNAGILGAVVGSTGDAIMSQEPQSNATNAPLDEEPQIVLFTPQRQSTLSREAETIDPEIVPRQIRPAIDPKHGDLLPLPPSRSESPLPKLSDDFPPLPESRPETPEHERHSREAPTHTRRRSTLETPTRPKTPSQSAIPIQFFRPGHRHTPSNGKSSSPSVSPITATVEFGSESKNRSRPASWEASRDFKPLLLLQRALRGSIDLSSSPERESSPSGSELRERGSPSSAHLILESPDRDHPFRDNIFSGPLSSPVGISTEKPETSHAAEKTIQLHEGAFKQLPSEASFHRNNRTDGSHLSPLPEESDLKLVEDDSHNPFSSPTFLVAPKIGDQGDSAQVLLKGNLEDSVASTEAAMPIMGEPEIRITSDDRSSSQANEATVSVETPYELLPVSDFFPGSKTPDSTDTFDTALSNAGDHGPLESSGSLDNAQDDDKIQERGLGEIQESMAGSTTTKVTPFQDEILSGITYERTLPTGQADSVPAYVATKDALRASEEDVEDNESIETLTPEQLPLAEKKPATDEELTFNSEEPALPESKVPEVEANSPTIKLHAEPEPALESALISLDMVAVEKPTAPEPEISSTEPIATPEPVLPSGEASTVETEPSAGEDRIENEIPTIIGVGSASEQEPALPNAKLEKPEQLETIPELSPGASEKDEENEDIQRPLLENEQAEPATSVEEPTKEAEGLTQETSVESPHIPPVDPQISSQDQPEATSPKLRDGQLDSPEEIPTIETSEKEENKTQTTVPKLEDQVIDEQMPATEEEGQPLSKSPSLSIVRVEDQQPDTPVEGFVEALASPIQTEQQPNLFSESESISEQVLQEEPTKHSEVSRDDEKTSREMPSPNQPVGPILSNLAVDSHDDLQSTVPVLGQAEQPQLASKSVLEETQSLEDSIKPEVSIVDGEQHDEQPTLTETNLQRSVEQESSGSASLKDTKVDESPLKRDILGGEDTWDRQGPASTDPTDVPFSKPDWSESPEDKQDKSAVPIQAAEEAPSLTPEIDNAQLPSLSNEVVNEEAPEMTQSPEKPGSEKGESKEMSQDASEVVDTSVIASPNPEPAAEPTPFEADVSEPRVVSDVPEMPSQDLDNELDASIAEEQSSVPQSTVEDVQEQVIEQAEPIADIVSSEPDSSSKESQKKREESQVDTVDVVDAPTLSGELESEESKKSVGEPTIVETDADSKPPPHFPAPEVNEVDVTAVTQVENQAPESKSTPGKEDEDEEKRGPIQVETVTNDIPQETPEILDARGDADKEVTSPTQRAIDRISDDTEVVQAKEDTDVSPTTKQLETDEKPENIPTDTEETPASVILPEISTEPGVVSEDTMQTGENFGLDPNPPSIEGSEKDQEKPQSTQFPGPLEQEPMETSVEPVGETPAPDTTFNPDWASINVPPPPDYLPESEVHSQEVSDSFGDASKAQQEPSQGQPIDPLDQLIQHIEAKTQSNTLDDIRDGPDLKDFDVAAGTQVQAPQEDAEDSMEAQNNLLAKDASKHERDSVEQPSSEIALAAQENANANLPIEADAVHKPSTQDESQVIPILPAQDTPPTEASPTAVLEPQDKIEQPSESLTNDSVLATSQVGEPTRAMPTSSEDNLSNPLTEHAILSDSQAESNPVTEDKTQSTIEILPTIVEEGESEDQDALDSTIGAVVPMTESIASEPPVIAEPVESVSQPHQDDPQSPINQDKGKEKEISQVQEREPESPPLPIEPPTEQPQSPTPESSQPQDVMPLDPPLVQEIKTEPHLTEQAPPGLSDLPTPGTSKTATGTLDISPSTTKETEPRASDVTGTTVHSQDSEQEPGVQTDKAGDDMLIIRPEIAPSGEVTNVQDQEKTRQTNDLTENAMLEEEPVAEPVRDDESLGKVVTPRPKKIKEGKKRGSQSIFQDDMTSIPSQETTDSAPSIPATADEVINPTKSAIPIISEELSLPPSDRVDEPTETAITIVQQDDSRSPTNNQSTVANAKEIVELEPRGSESVSKEDKEGEENKLTLLDDNLSEQIPEQAAKESPVVLSTDEQSEIQVPAPTETSTEGKLDEPVSPRKDKKEKKAKGGNSHEENAAQVERSQVSMDTTDDNEWTDVGRSIPQQSPEGADIIDPGPIESKETEVKDVGRSHDVQSQEQNQAEFESAAQPGISEIAETENLTLENLKDEKVEEAAPAKKGKKNKKKKRASLRQDEAISQQESAQLNSDLAASTSAIEPVNAEKLSVPENLADQDAAVLTSSQKDDEEKEPSTQEPELEAEILAEPEPDSIPQQLESPMEVISTDVPPDVPLTSIEDTVPIEESPSTGLPEAPVESTSIEEAPIVNTQDNRLSTENIPTVAPPQIVEEQVERGTLSESDIPPSDQTPAENIATIPTSEEPNTEDTAQSEVVQPETVSQVPEEQINLVSSTPSRGEPVSQGPVQSDEKHEILDPIASETPAEVVQLKEFPESENLQPAESTQLKAVVSGEPMQTQDSPKQGPAQLEEPIATEEPLNQEELPKLEELAQRGESEQLVSAPHSLSEVEAPAQQDPVQPEESTQRSEPELLAQTEEPTQLGSSVNPVQELPVILDETESTLTKKSKKSNKKRVNHTDPELATESTQLVETQPQKELPKQSREQPVDQRAEHRASWGFFGGLTDSFKSLLSIQEPTTASKDNENTDLPEVPTKSESKSGEKEASQLEAEPTPRTVPSSEPIEQSQHLDSQLIVDDTSTVATDAVPEDALPEVATSKKSKKKKKKASQVSQEPESSATAPLESQAQPIFPEESPIQESQEQLDASPKVEHTTAPRGEEKSREDPSQSSGSKMSKKERRKMKKLAALAAELFQPEPDLKVKDEPAVPKTVPGPSEPPPEPVNPNWEVQNAPITNTTSTSLQEEGLQLPTVEAESSIQPIQGQVGDLAEKIGEEIGAATDQDGLAPSSEPGLITSEVENITKDTRLDGTPNAIGEGARDVQESKEALPDIPVEDLEKGKEALILNTPEPSTGIPNSDPQSQSLPDIEKQDETTASTEPLTGEEQLPMESDKIPEPIKTPEISATEQQELPINEQLDFDPSAPKEPEPQPSPISRKKSKRDKKKKRMNAQTGLETGSGTQTPVSQKPNTGHNSSDIITGEPAAQGLERTTVNEGEWLKSPNNPPQDETRRKASGTSTPLESIEDVLANASPDTVAEENAPRRLTPENISEVEGQGSKAKDVEEGIPPKPKDQDQNAENINISHPDENSVEVPEITRLPSPVSERHPGKGPLSETRQDNLDHVELPGPVTPPRTPSTVAAHTVNVDLSPAQLSSHIEHERPFDQSPQPGKRIRTYLSSGDPTVSELLPSQFKLARNTESSGYEARGLLPPAGSYMAETSDNNLVSHDITPSREIAVSYLESQLITKAENSHDVEENGGIKQISTSGLLPALIPRREIATSYFEGQPSIEIQPHDDTPEDTTGKFVVNAPLVAMDENISTSPAESQLTQLNPGHIEEETPLAAQPEARQPNPVQDTTTPARKIAAILMESFHSSKKATNMHKDADSAVPDIMPAASSTGEAAHLTEKYANMKTPDTQGILDNRVVSEISEPKVLEDKHAEVNASDQETGPSTVADEQKEAPSSDLKEIEPSGNLPTYGGVSSEIESPVVGREVQQSLPEPRSASREGPASREPPTTEIIKRLDDLDTSEHTSEPSEPTAERKIDEVLLKSPSSRPLIQDYGNSGRNSPRVLPPVKEETGEEVQNEGRNRGDGITNETSIITQVNRDSGFVTDSPNPMRRSSVAELSVRDSGVHLRDWPEKTPQKTAGLEDKSSVIRTPQPNEKRSKKLGLGSEAPDLSTPIARSQDEVRDTQDTRDTIDVRKTRLSKSQDVKCQDVGQRSVSETISRGGSGSTARTENQPRRSASNTSISRLKTPEPLPFRPESPGGRNFRSGSNTPPLALRRTGKRMSGDLRSLSSNLSNNNKGSRENIHQTQTQQQLQQTKPTKPIPVANEGRVRAKDMTDVYDGYGEGRIGSPRSPTRPQSMRRRQSIQVLELESRVEQLVAENRALADEKAHVEQSITHRTASAITERDAEIESLKASLDWLHKEVNRLTEVNEGLHSANNVLADQHNEKYKRLESQHASAAKELENLRLAQDNYDRTIQEKDSEIQELRAQLEVTKEQVREMQRQILAHKPPDADFLRLKDEDHFDHRCQQLCQHVQQWVLRFSKFSDMRACRLTSEINDEKIIDRLDNAVLDGSDVDEYLSDRVRRRDIFMSMTMNMIWEFVFTRYLFGMDREHRQKLKSLEKLLLEVGPPHAVRQWRAVTLTLLSKRPAFGDQRNQDTEAVVQAIFQTLCMILPPPSNLEAQIQSQLRRVMREAVDLSIEMRTQRAEYMMLPPLQPEYDANGDLVRTVAFNAALMNERSGDSVPNDQYEVQRAIVRTVLFPLVVKKGDDNGVGDEEVVICPAQVLVAKPPRHATIRIVTPTSDTALSRGATPSAAAPSTVSLQMQDAPLPMPTPPQEAEYLEGGI